MASRTWLAVILACFIWFGYLKWFAPPPPTSHPSTTTEAKSTNSAQPAAVPTGLFGAIPAPGSTQTFSTALSEIDFSDAGGRVSEIRLKHYREKAGKESPPITTVGAKSTPFALESLFSATELAPLGTAAYKPSTKGSSIIYEASASGGIRFTKEYVPQTDGYFIDSTWTLKFPDAKRADWGYLIVPLGASQAHFEANDPLLHWETVVYQNESATRKTIDSIDEGDKVLQGNTGWLAFGNRYFATALVTQSTINPDAVLHKGANFSGGYLRFPLVLKEGQQELSFKFRIFSGPKDHSLLAGVPGLKQLVDYGAFAVLAYPLLEVLRFFYKYFHNWGVSIILMTLLVRIIFYPLSLKSYRSMKAMQKLNPQIQALKEKYKDNKEKFTQEQLALFKTHKVNPAGGCLPMLVQLPVLIAFYSVLANSIELFHAPFFGWVQDLSTKDPFYVFPVLMGVSMLIQQKLTPTVGMDPTQAKMMLIMPVVFTAMMINLPSGLTIYMFVSTMLGILQQYYMTKEPSENGRQKVISSGVTSAPEKNS